MADCLSSAFERTKYQEYNEKKDGDYQVSRLVPLFEELSTEKDKRENLTPDRLKYRYPLKPLSPASVFPELRHDATEDQATKEYRDLWNAFVEDIKKVHDRENHPVRPLRSRTFFIRQRTEHPAACLTERKRTHESRTHADERRLSGSLTRRPTDRF